MVKRTPPLAVAVIGTGEASKKSVEALLTDFTAPYADVTFILPVTNEHWTDTTGVVADWLAENDIPYVAVTTGDPVDKTLVPHLEAADSVQKVARVSTKVVQLLQQEKGDGDVALLVAWEDDDTEAVAAVNKALTAEVAAYNLLDGLDEFTFDDDEGDDAEHEAEVAEANGDAEQEAAAQVGDEYDDWGVRKLRAALREHPNKAHSDRQIGQLDKDDAIRALRVADQAALRGDEPADVDEEGAEDTGKAERTTRARRAFREGVAEATGQDEAQVDLPNSRGGTLLEEQTGDPDDEPADEVQEPETGQFSFGDKGFTTEDTIRQQALELAVRSGKSGGEAVTDAIKYEVYLRGERSSLGGRPRADGTPAKPREINPETGKPVRRRAPRSTE